MSGPKLGDVDGGNATRPGFALISVFAPVTPPLLAEDPSGWSIKWEKPQYVLVSKGETRREYKYADRVRFTLRVDWDYLSANDRELLIRIINHNINGEGLRLIRVWPHNEMISIYYDCNVVEDNVDQYLIGVPMGYGPNVITLRANKTVPAVPLFERGYHFTRSADVGVNYLATDEIAHLTRSTDVADDNYSASDKIGFFWRGNRDLIAPGP